MSPIHDRFLAHHPALEAELGEAIFVSGLTGPLRIFQRRAGHRHSIDDTTTAWYALQKTLRNDHVLDLGTGIGSVGLVVLWGLGAHATLTCVEAQEVSYRLLRANITCNGLESRVQALHGDLRTLDLGRHFHLITGSPPYFPLGSGVLPLDSQKAHARFELRGDVGDYARTAKRHLHPEGVFVFCFPAPQRARCIELVERAGLSIATLRDVVPRPGKSPLFTLYSARHHGQVEKMIEETPFMVMNAQGEHTEEMMRMQRSRGFGADGTNTLT